MTTNGINALPLLLGDAPSGAVSACAAAVTSLAQNAFAAVPRVDWAGFAIDIGAKIKEMFEIDLAAVVAGAWSDFRELRECADRARHPPDETIFVPLVDHHVDARFAPYFDIAIGALPALRVRFEIDFDIELQGVTAKIQDATIRAFRAGSCQAKATLKCDGALVFERSTRQLELPGEITLETGIPIAPHSISPIPLVSA
jgi:hypothetical protein